MKNSVEQTSSLIWSDLFCIKNEDLSREEQIKLIEKRLLPALQNQRRVGVDIASSYMKTTLEDIQDKMRSKD